MPAPTPEFVPSTDFSATPPGGLWFAFVGRALLVTSSFEVPRVASLAQLQLTPVRTQLLGHLGEDACLSAELPANTPPPPGMQFRELRQLLGRLPEPLFALAARAVQIVHWDRTHQFCGACGSPTQPSPRGHRARVCVRPDCQLEQYPRVSPAMIVAVERGDEILLARGPQTPAGIYTTLAGFVDPGESAEEAVAREVFEETGIRVKNVRYFGSQPWPFPHSLMLGFQADYAGGELVLQADEIEAAGFYRFDALPPLFPGQFSIAQWLIRDFLKRHGRAPG